jgi:NADH-quinone oxidoreductase subunit L
MDINWLDPNYTPWLILALPFVSFALIVLFFGSSKTLSHITAIGSVTISWLLSWGLFIRGVFETADFGQAVYAHDIDWMDLGATTFKMGVMVDPLTAIMLFMVPFVMLMIFIYSVGYMGAYAKDDPHQIRNARFFAYLSLFAGAMLTLVVADNLLLLFIGWEVMGLCSYLLIGFLIEKKSANQAAVKAFMTTRVADVLFLVGIGYLYAQTGTLSFREIMYANQGAMLEQLASSTAPILGMSAAALIGILLVIGTIGKAAQFPLHVWLPDAMEGPTPVSAMIHAAAMVTAGVYMVIRMYPLLAAGGNPHTGDYTEPMILMGAVGSITALLGAVLGVGQDDIKRVLAYSTVSQLGFMVAALGIGAWVAAVFHLITHAFFKALLFMSSGAVIHSMEHGEHHAHAHHGHAEHHHEEGHRGKPAGQPYGMMHAYEDEELPIWNTSMVPDGIQPDYVADPNNMRHMGGLKDRIPLTAIAMLAGGLSLAGFPLLTAGFWSKDEILADAWIVGTEEGVLWLHILVFFSLVIAATFTAFYTGRLWLLTFWGKPRSEAAKHATLMSGHSVDSEKLEAIPAHSRWMHAYQDDYVGDELRSKPKWLRWLLVYRDSLPLQLPLLILAFFAITAGWVGIHEDFWILKELTGGNNFFKDLVKYTLVETPEAPPFDIVPVLFSFGAALFGLGLAGWTYGLFYDLFGVGMKPVEAGEKDPVHNAIGDAAWAALQNRFYIDMLYLKLLYVPFEWFGRRFTYEEVDKKTIDELLTSIGQSAVTVGEAVKRFNYVVIDGVGDGIPLAITAFSRWFRNIQSGRAQQYMLFGALALLAMGALLVIQAL